LCVIKIENEEPFGQLEEECAQYVAGYVGNRLCHEYPEIIVEIGEPNAGWIKQLSKGNLKISSKNLMNAVKIIKATFIHSVVII